MLVPLSLSCAAALLRAFMARQLRTPSGAFGRRVMGAMLNDGNRQLLDSVVNAVGAGPGARIVDVGFGGGYTLERLAPIVRPGRVAGVEISESMIDALRARSKDAFDLCFADAAALPFRDASLDRVLSVNTIYFWPDPARVLGEMHRVLKPGGRLALGYRPRALLRLHPVTWFGFRLYSDKRTTRLLKQAGFDVEIRSPALAERIAVGTKT